MSRSYLNLTVWRKAMDLVVECFQTTKRFPAKEVCGLTTQVQRAAVSIPTSIAAGREQKYDKEFLRHLSLAHGSVAELENYLSTAQGLHYLNEHETKRLLDQTAEISYLLDGLQKSLGKTLGC